MLSGMLQPTLFHGRDQASFKKVILHAQLGDKYFIKKLSLLQYHYMVFHVDVKKGCRRKFLPDGTEIEPDFGAKQKVNTGFLMSSYSKYQYFSVSSCLLILIHLQILHRL